MTRSAIVGFVLLCVAPIASAQTEGADPGGSDFAADALDLPGQLELHRPNYVMPITWTDDAQDSDDIEFKFQISLRHQVADTPFYLGYTQVSYWRWMDEAQSRPFREVNYNPEVWYRYRRGRLPLEWLGLDIGYEHESNGGNVGQSRSWNRVYVRPWFEEGNWRGQLRIWYRIPEEEKSGPNDPTGDDNPNIIDYYGHHELRLEYRFDNGHRVAVATRYASSDDRGSVKLEYAIPTPGDSYFFFQLFSGYGESLETFRENRTRGGIGFALLR